MELPQPSLAEVRVLMGMWPTVDKTYFSSFRRLSEFLIIEEGYATIYIYYMWVSGILIIHSANMGSLIDAHDRFVEELRAHPAHRSST